MDGRVNPYNSTASIQKVWDRHHQVVQTLTKMPLIPTEKIKIDGGQPVAHALYIRTPDTLPSAEHVISVHRQLGHYVQFHNARLNAAEKRLQRIQKISHSTGNTTHYKALLHATNRRNEILWDRDAAVIELEMSRKTNYFPHVKSEVIRRLEGKTWHTYFADTQSTYQNEK